MREKKVDTKNRNSFIAMTLLILLSMAFIVAVPLYEDHFIRIISVSDFLTWHNMLEIAGVIAYLAIFLVSFYTYKQDNNVKPIFFGSLLMASGIIDAFHLLSYKGMPDFFIPNLTSNRATTYWIAARLIAAAAYLGACLINNEKKSTISRYWFTAAGMAMAVAVLIVVTYFPDLLPAMYIEEVGLTYEKRFLEYVIIAMTSIAAMFYLHRYRTTKNHSIYIMFTALILSIISEFAFVIYVDVYGVYNFIGHIFKCISLFLVFRAIFSKFVLSPYMALAEAQNELRDYADNLDRLVEQRTSELKMINDKLIEDIEYARDIQKSMLPTFYPNSPHISFSSLYMPAERLSGDFYDVFWLDENHIGFYVCDVSGHGVPAAMLTVFLKQCFERYVEAGRMKDEISSPAEMLNQIYDAFNHSNFRDEVYIVLIYFIYDVRERKLVFSSAGMNEAPLHLDANGQLRDIDIKGFPICKLKQVFEASYENMEILTSPGDKLFIYSDGLVEIRNRHNEQYSNTRLKELISQNKESPSDKVIAAIMDDLQLFTGGREHDDDITLICVEFR